MDFKKAHVDPLPLVPTQLMTFFNSSCGLFNFCKRTLIRSKDKSIFLGWSSSNRSKRALWLFGDEARVT